MADEYFSKLLRMNESINRSSDSPMVAYFRLAEQGHMAYLSLSSLSTFEKPLHSSEELITMAPADSAAKLIILVVDLVFGVPGARLLVVERSSSSISSGIIRTRGPPSTSVPYTLTRD